MPFRRLLILLCVISLSLKAQQRATLPEVTFIAPATDHYVWERVGKIKGRLMFHNTIACSDSVVYSFGGFDTLHAHREMNVFSRGRLIREPIQYPGIGTISNLFFINKDYFYIGGGHDSGRSRYAQSDFWRYDVRSKEWKRLRDIPFYYIRPLYTIPTDSGALIFAATLKDEGLEHATPALFEYHAADDTWSLRSQILRPSEYGLPTFTWGLFPSVFRIENELFVLLIDCCNTDRPLGNSFFKLNMRDGSWTQLPAFPGGNYIFRFGLSDGEYGYIGGGIGAPYFNSKEVYRYDPRREQWRRIENLPQGLRHAIGWNFQGENYVGFGLTDDFPGILIYRLRKR